MALQTSGPISIFDIVAEFGQRGTTPMGLNEYADEVGKTGTTGQNLSLADFYGASAGGVLSLTFNQFVSGFTLLPQAAFARIAFNTFTFGTCTTSSSNSTNQQTQWITPGGSSLPQYQI
jgi:hypothetical protein